MPGSPQHVTRESVSSRLHAVDWILLGLLSAFIFLLCLLRSHGRLPWLDETFGFRVVCAPSLGQTLRGWWYGADGGGPVYYVLAHAWTVVFGRSELSLRLFSAMGMATALVLVWTAARRYFSTLAVACAVGLVFFTIPVMLWEEVSGRFYGTFLAFAALASLLFLLISEAAPGSAPGSSRSLRLPTAIAHIGLVGSHILGVAYSASLIAGMMVLGRRNGHRHWKTCLAAATGWLMVPISWHAMRASASIAEGSFWTHRPGARDLLLGFAAYGKWSLYALALLVPLAGLRAWVFPRPSARRHQPLMPLVPAALIGSLVLAQVVLFSKSLFGISVYSDRYLLPLSIAAVLLISALVHFLLPQRLTTSLGPLKCLAASVLVLTPACAYAVTHDILAMLYPPTGYIQQVTTGVPPGAPILVTNLGPFALLSDIEPTHPYLFLDDTTFDLQHPQLPSDISGELLMENWKRAGYEPGHILNCPDLLASYPDFYLLLDPTRQPWLQERLLAGGNYELYKVRDLPPAWVPLSLWHVHRLHPSKPC